MTEAPIPCSRTDRLRSVRLLATLRDEQLQALSMLSKAVSIDAGTVLCDDVTGAHQSFVILDGTAVVTRNGLTVDKVGPGAFVGELAALAGGEVGATVSAMTPLSALALPTDALRAALDDVPGVRRALERDT